MTALAYHDGIEHGAWWLAGILVALAVVFLVAALRERRPGSDDDGIRYPR